MSSIDRDILRQSISDVLHRSEIGSWLDLVTSVAVDSRQVRPGALFIALPGNVTDGHLYIEDAIERGAVAAIVEKPVAVQSVRQIPFVQRKNSLQVLQEIAGAIHKKRSSKVIAITGSVGKTTTKEFAAMLIASEQRVFCTPGNMNSQIGLPLSLINDPVGDEECYIIEIGMTHPGNIERLVKVIPPHIAMITSIHYVHAANFTSLKEIALAKKEIFSSSELALRVLNQQSHEFQTLSDGIEHVPLSTFSSSFHDNAQYQICRKDGMLHIYEQKKEMLSLKDPEFLAEHVYENCIAAIALARAVGVSWKGILAAIPRLKMPEKRLEMVAVGGVHFLNDAYNASEPSMISVLDAFHKLVPKGHGKKIAVLGQMRELGQFSQECHRRVAEKAIQVADCIVCFGEEAKIIYQVALVACIPTFWTNSFEELIEYLETILAKDDIVLLKGARSNRLERVIELFQKHLFSNKLI